METDPAEIERKLPVWAAFSNLFLDTELQDQEYRSIARTLRSSGYSPDQLRSILLDEVAPAFVFNLVDVAGEWTPWSEDDVRRIMLRSRSALPPIQWVKRRMFKRHVEAEWEKIALLLAG